MHRILVRTLAPKRSEHPFPHKIDLDKDIKFLRGFFKPLSVNGFIGCLYLLMDEANLT